MASYRDTQKRTHLRVAISENQTGSGENSAQIILLKTHRKKQNAAPKTALSPELENLLAALKTELTIAVGVSRGLGETLNRFESCLGAIDNEIERGEVLQLQATVMKQTAHLRATVLAASADLRRVLPDTIGQVLDVPPSDIVYS